MLVSTLCTVSIIGIMMMIMVSLTVAPGPGGDLREGGQ
jgi:hypothetical protein